MYKKYFLALLVTGLFAACTHPPKSANYAEQISISSEGESSEFVSKDFAYECLMNYEKSEAYNALSGLKSAMMGISKFQELLNQEGVAGARFYYAMNEIDGGELEPAIYIYATDRNGNDIQAKALDDAAWCPPFCPDGWPKLHVASIGNFFTAETALSARLAYEQSSIYTAMSGVKSHSWTMDALTKVISQEDVAGIRLSLGMQPNENGSLVPNAILQGVDEDGNELEEFILGHSGEVNLSIAMK